MGPTARLHDTPCRAPHPPRAPHTGCREQLLGWWQCAPTLPPVSATCLHKPRDHAPWTPWMGRAHPRNSPRLFILGIIHLLLLLTHAEAALPSGPHPACDQHPCSVATHLCPAPHTMYVYQQNKTPPTYQQTALTLTQLLLACRTCQGAGRWDRHSCNKDAPPSQPHLPLPALAELNLASRTWTQNCSTHSQFPATVLQSRQSCAPPVPPHQRPWCNALPKMADDGGQSGKDTAHRPGLITTHLNAFQRNHSVSPTLRPAPQTWTQTPRPPPASHPETSTAGAMERPPSGNALQVRPWPMTDAAALPKEPTTSACRASRPCQAASQPSAAARQPAISCCRTVEPTLTSHRPTPQAHPTHPLLTHTAGGGGGDPGSCSNHRAAPCVASNSHCRGSCPGWRGWESSSRSSNRSNSCVVPHEPPAAAVAGGAAGGRNLCAVLLARYVAGLAWDWTILCSPTPIVCC